ncbi:hypothetical protein GCM10009548_77310 [Streptomyces malaysiensis subsp. malaysiensis]|uniref:Uncharacterized protein n=2 Tax=Streptomyces TaxID=1883 RepID=A0A2J7YWH3_STRMQ|nr:hypothetical protein [Streptomyces sp. MnatMP-M27]AQA14494.1 hypothetical protein BV401_32835 [Streptomyces autolyticus]MYU15418.1 hypothetical protein [Streptomyces sp. SID8361]PNG92382.1 hypothetical protein SMF913_27847 [Streptomyces malaysiensis]QDL70334.1 hypothetical protein DNK48_14010 [Streptomyces malaysiensis]
MKDYVSCIHVADHLLDAFPGMWLAVDPQDPRWRTNTIIRGLTAAAGLNRRRLPATFTMTRSSS